REPLEELQRLLRTLLLDLRLLEVDLVLLELAALDEVLLDELLRGREALLRPMQLDVRVLDRDLEVAPILGRVAVPVLLELLAGAVDGELRLVERRRILGDRDLVLGL